MTIRVLKTIAADAIRTADGMWQIEYDDGHSETISNKEFLQNFRPTDGVLCESCGKYIDSYMDDYYGWNEGVVTCTDCGGPKELLIKGGYALEV